MSDHPFSEIDIYVEAISGGKAKNIVALDVRGMTSIADFFILCSATSSRQVLAISEKAGFTLKNDHQTRPLSVEGGKGENWILMDYGNVIIHVFLEETRAFYDLDGFWMDAKRIDIRDIEARQKIQMENSRDDDDDDYDDADAEYEDFDHDTGDLRKDET